MISRRRIVVGGVALLAIGLAAAFSFLVVERSVTRTIRSISTQQALAWSGYFVDDVADLAAVIAGEAPSGKTRETIDRLGRYGNVFRLELYDAEGMLVLVSDELDVPPQFRTYPSEDETAASVAASSRPTVLAFQDTGRIDRPRVWTEAYVPILDGERLIGVANAHVDQTRLAREVRRSHALLSGLTTIIVATAVGVPLLLLLTLARRLSGVNRELRGARDAALGAERAKMQFLATVSHEIRTPMNGVLGMSQLLAGTDLDDTQRSFVATIESSAQGLLRVVNDVLDFSRIDGRGLLLRDAPLAVEDIASGPARLLAPQAHAKGLELLVRIDPRLPGRLGGDLGRLQQIVTNLLGNAVKFTENGQILLEIAMKGAAGERIMLGITVVDTGIGIPHAKLGSIFEMFQQVGGEDRPREGTGLGLAIARGLVERMDGTITVTSEAGRGTTFACAIPLTRIENAEPKPEPLAIRRVLIVDDNATARATLAEMLAANGVESVAVATAPEALVRIRASSLQPHPFEALIVDRTLPRTSAAGLVEALRHEPGAGSLPVLVLDVLGEAGRWPAVRGAQAVISKPVLPGELRAELKTLRARPRGLPAQPTLAALPAPAETASAPEGAPPAAPSSGMTLFSPAAPAQPDVLVVEDNKVNQLVAQNLLKRLGLTVATAENGAEGAELFRTLRPRAVLMDISMPVMNGFEATALIRDYEIEAGLRRTPIVALTAHSLDEDRRRCLDAGMDHFLSKPISLERLAAILAPLRPASAA